tara:strand:+ start:232 stop:606 length:375 start_codon:yes stop_codon:yes gene_type:complete
VFGTLPLPAPVAAIATDDRVAALEKQVADLTATVERLKSQQTFSKGEVELFVEFDRIFGLKTERYMDEHNIVLANGDGSMSVHSALKLIVLRLNEVQQSANAALTGVPHSHGTGTVLPGDTTLE